MAAGSQVTVTTSATLLVAAVARETRNVLLHTAAAVYVGGDTSLTTANGFLLDASNGPVPFILNGGEALYAIKATGTTTTYVFITEL
jgi:hypothetical protein